MARPTEDKARFIFPVLMAGIMAFLMTGLITWLNLGFPPGFGWLWARAFLIAWPAATVAAFCCHSTGKESNGKSCQIDREKIKIQRTNTILKTAGSP